MDGISNLISTYSVYIILSLIIINILLFIMNMINSTRIGQLKKRYNKLTDEIKDKDLENVIIDYYSMVKEIVKKNSDIEKQMKIVEGKLQLCAQKIGVIRYNAFDNVGSNLSFAIAMLDSNDNGFIINGVYTRDSSTTYAKPVISGKAKYTLSAEEMQALDLAKRNYNERKYETS